MAGPARAGGAGAKDSSVLFAPFSFFWPRPSLLGPSWRLLGSFWASLLAPREPPGGHFGRCFDTSGAGPRKSVIFIIFDITMFPSSTITSSLAFPTDNIAD